LLDYKPLDLAGRVRSRRLSGASFLVDPKNGTTSDPEYTTLARFGEAKLSSTI
jgi:hypothetical protein